MSITANIILIKNEFVATLSDGRRLKKSDLHELADALARVGIHACDVQFEWNGSTGQRMITAGQQVAMRAEMRRLEREPPKSIAVAA